MKIKDRIHVYVTEEVEEYTSIESIIQQASIMAKGLGCSLQELCLEWERYSERYDDQEYFRVFMKGRRLETDEEYHARKQKDEDWKASRIAEEKKMLESLKKKYEA